MSLGPTFQIVEISEYLVYYLGLSSNCRDNRILSVLLGLTFRDNGILSVSLGPTFQIVEISEYLVCY